MASNPSYIKREITMFEGIENKPYYDDWTNPQLDPKSEQFRNAYNSVVNDYGKENADAQLKDWGIQFENEVEAGNINPEQLPENSPIQKEAEQLYDSNPNNDEVKNDAVEDFIKQMEAGQPTKQEQDEAAYMQQLNDMQLADDISSSIDNYDMLHFTPEEDKPTDYMWAPGSFMRKDIKDSVNLINSYPTSQKRAALELLARISNGDIDSYEDMLKANPWMDEAMYEAIASIASNDNKSGRIPVISKSSKRNKEAMENFIEKHPEEAAATLPDEAKQEAEQVLDNDKRNDEVNDKKIGKFLKSGVDWGKVKLYEPNEDPYYKVTDELDWKNNPDHEPDFIETPEKDEDFLGPDEYIDENGNIQVDPNWKPENADEDFVGPDEQLAVINSGLPAEIEPTYDTSDYNFDWEYDIQTLGVNSPEEIPDAPVENEEQAKAKQRLMKWLNSHGHGYRMSEPDNDMSSREDIHNNYRNGGRAAGSSLLGNIGQHSGLSYDAPSVKSLGKEDKHGGPTNSTASGSVELPNSEKPTERTMSLSTINSGETMFGKSGMLGSANLNKGGEIKVGQSGIKANFTGHTSKPEELAPKPMSGSGSNGIYADLITQILRKFPNGYADNQITITVNGQNVLVNGKQLSQLSDIEIQTLKEIL